MKRYKGIDFFRGFCIFFMVFGHLLNWWLTPKDYWLYLFLYSFLAPIAASGFLFISGLSASLANNNWLIKVNDSNEYNMYMVRRMYIFRALLLLAISFIYNTAIAIAINDLTWIWAWFALQTIGFSILMAWPFLRTSKIFRIILGGALLIANSYLYELLLPYEGELSAYGVLFHILFNPKELYPILSFFSMFIIGTVLGDILFDMNLIDDQEKRRRVLKEKFLFPFSLIGVILTIFSISFLFPSFLLYYTFSARIYSLGMMLILIPLIIGIEEFEVFKLKKKYTFFHYYSYYSFTIFLAHNPLYFLFYHQLTVFTIWIPMIITLIIISLIIRLAYKKLGPKASLKVAISVLSFNTVMKVEQRKKIKKS